MTDTTTDLRPDPATEVHPRRVTSGKLVSNLVLLFFGLFFIVPLLWLFLASVDQNATGALAWPTFTMDNFVEATSGSNLNALLNSVYISLIATVVSTVPAVMAAYAFSRHHIPWKGPLLLIILLLSGVPITILIVPVYEQFLNLGLLQLVPAAIFLGVTTMPFEIWIIKNFIDAVPTDLEEAARLERAKTHQVILRVVAPVAMPGIAAATIFGFILAWGNFLIPLVLIPSTVEQPAPVALYGILGGVFRQWGPLAAYSLLYSIPIVILYLLLARLFRGGFALSGAIRG